MLKFNENYDFSRFESFCEWGEALPDSFPIGLGSLENPVKSCILVSKEIKFLESFDPSEYFIVSANPKFPLNKVWLKVKNEHYFLKECLEALKLSRSRLRSNDILSTLELTSKSYSESAVIYKEAKLGENLKICEKVVIYPETSIGDNTVIEPGCIIYPGTIIGSNCHIMANSVIGSEGFGFAEAKESIERIPQLGGVEIGNDCEIGPLCTIDSGTIDPTTLGNYCKLDAHCHIGHNCKLGNNVYIAAQTGFSGSTIIGSNVGFSGQCATTGHLKITSNTKFMGRTVVTKNINESGIYGGFPAEPANIWRRKQAFLSRAIKKEKK